MHEVVETHDRLRTKDTQYIKYDKTNSARDGFVLHLAKLNESVTNLKKSETRRS